MMVLLITWMLTMNLVLSATYQANLLTFFFLPFTSEPIDTLEGLHRRMSSSNFTLTVTDGSSSHGILSTGSGVYGQMWNIMQERGDWLISSVEDGLVGLTLK